MKVLVKKQINMLVESKNTNGNIKKDRYLLQLLPKILGTQRNFAIKLQSIHAQGPNNQKALRCKGIPPPPKTKLRFVDKTLPRLIAIDL